MNPKQNHARPNKRPASLEGKLPKVLVERHEDPRFRFGQIQEFGVLRSGAVGPGPKDVVARVPEPIDNRLRKVLVCEEAHQGLIYAGIGYTLYSCAR